MSNKEKLEQLIQKAVDGGWDIFGTENHQLEVFESTYADREYKDGYYSDAPHDGLFLDVRRNGYYSVNDIIFDHNFAKAIWGDELYKTDGSQEEWGYQWHLQQMVISDDPINYAWENS